MFAPGVVVRYRYYRNSEAMHVLLNITKTVWAVFLGVPRHDSFWTHGRRLAVLWKFGLDSLLVSGLGELVSSASALVTPSSLLLLLPWRLCYGKDSTCTEHNHSAGVSCAISHAFFMAMPPNVDCVG